MPLSPLLNAPGLASLLADAKPRVVVGTSDQVAMLDAVRRDYAAQPLPGWVLVDPAPSDEDTG